ncbi:Excinuclease ABC subunit C [Bryocella elongata]|uniref:UvrABC system protein C n=1 Tax=Bryocella elongata TaxID=863522 RepID=A0A1H5U0K9_9BACT|nr:excinuclease ABC subunit UvrC [Bryocella elongata]SEF68644.1 Excinuclease ABC subunit C [Bryocella elongata]
MDLHEKIRTLPTGPGCYLYKNAEGQVIYVGKAKNLRARVRSYFLAASQANAKTGSLMREAVDIEYILVGNEREALALENNLIKQRKPRFNILLRDDKTYPYIKLTLGDRHPKVFVTRRLRRDGSAYFGPYFPGNLAHRLVDLIHRSFLIPSCKVDLNRYHPRACLQYYIKRCLGPCVKDLISTEDYRSAIRDVQLFLEGKSTELEARLHQRMADAAENMQFELAARLRDQLITVSQAQDRQRIESAEEEDIDVFGFHFENEMLAVNLFHMRGGKIVDRREMFWEDLPELEDISLAPDEEEVADQALEPEPNHIAPEIVDDSATLEEHSVLASPFETGADGLSARASDFESQPGFSPAAFFSALLKQLYLDQTYVPKHIYSPVDFADRELLAEALRERVGSRIELAVPQRGDKRALVDLASQNAKQSYDQRFRVLAPSIKAIQESLQDALTLPELPERIECFDISHIQGAETVASMVVWEKGAMKKADYRKYQVKTVSGVDDFASMHEVLLRRYAKFANGAQPTGKDSVLPSLILIDGGLGQLHAAAAALEELGLTTQPLASIAKREEIIYVYGQEDEPVVLDRRSPVLHVVQKIRDESHRFAITYHRKRREMRDRTSELDEIPGVGAITRQRLLEHFGSVRALQQAAEKNPDSLLAVANKATAEKIRLHFAKREGGASASDLVNIET